MIAQQRYHALDINTSRAVLALQALEIDPDVPVHVLQAARQSVHRAQLGLEPDPDLGHVLQAFARTRQAQDRYGK